MHGYLTKYCSSLISLLLYIERAGVDSTCSFLRREVGRGLTRRIRCSRPTRPSPRPPLARWWAWRTRERMDIGSSLDKMCLVFGVCNVPELTEHRIPLSRCRNVVCCCCTCKDDFARGLSIALAAIDSSGTSQMSLSSTYVSDFLYLFASPSPSTSRFRISREVHSECFTLQRWTMRACKKMGWNYRVTMVVWDLDCIDSDLLSFPGCRALQ